MAGVAAGAVPLAGVLGSDHTAQAPMATPGTGDWMALRAARCPRTS
jgi:hypothetical protein